MKTKIFTALTALTLATAFSLPSTAAHARGGKGLLVGGLVGAAVVGTAIAASQPAYAGVRRCKIVDQFDRWGNYLGTTKVCRVYY